MRNHKRRLRRRRAGNKMAVSLNLNKIRVFEHHRLQIVELMHIQVVDELLNSSLDGGEEDEEERKVVARDLVSHKFIFGVIFSRCRDVSATVRAKALQGSRSFSVVATFRCSKFYDFYFSNANYTKYGL